MGFPGGSSVENLPVTQEMWVQSLGLEDLLEEDMATHSNTFLPEPRPRENRFRPRFR